MKSKNESGLIYTPWNEADIASTKKPSQKKKRVFQLLNSYSQVLYVRFLWKSEPWLLDFHFRDTNFGICCHRHAALIVRAAIARSAVFVVIGALRHEVLEHNEGLQGCMDVHWHTMGTCTWTMSSQSMLHVLNLYYNTHIVLFERCMSEIKKRNKRK